MAREVSTNGRKKVSTLMKEFNFHFPYLRIRFYRPEAKAFFEKESLTRFRVDINKTLSEIRTKKGSGEISFTGSKMVKTIESEFELLFGLFVQVCYTEKDGFMKVTTKEENDLSLSKLNEKCGQDCCKKNDWLGDDDEHDKATPKRFEELNKSLNNLGQDLSIMNDFGSYCRIISLLLYNKLDEKAILEFTALKYNSLNNFLFDKTLSFSKDEFKSKIVDCHNNLRGKTTSQKMTLLKENIDDIFNRDRDLDDSTSDIQFGKKIISILYADIKEILLFSGGIKESKDYLEVMERALHNDQN